LSKILKTRFNKIHLPRALRKQFLDEKTKYILGLSKLEAELSNNLSKQISEPSIWGHRLFSEEAFRPGMSLHGSYFDR
jgi:hypothetical protein